MKKADGTEYTREELLAMTPGGLIDLGVCPTCLDRESGGALYGDDAETLLYRDKDVECFFVKNPRAEGHACVSSVAHYHDMTEAPDELTAKMMRFVKRLSILIREVYGCVRVYFCSMCDGKNNHYHIQLIPRYPEEERGSKNFVKPRKAYLYDEKRFSLVKSGLEAFAEEE